MRFEIQVEGKSLEELLPYVEAITKIAQDNVRISDPQIAEIVAQNPQSLEFFHISSDTIMVASFAYWGTERRPYDDVAELSSVIPGEVVFLSTAKESEHNASFTLGGQFTRDGFKNGRPVGRWTAKPLEWESSSIF